MYKYIKYKNKYIRLIGGAHAAPHDKLTSIDLSQFPNSVTMCTPRISNPTMTVEINIFDKMKTVLQEFKRTHLDEIFLDFFRMDISKDLETNVGLTLSAPTSTIATNNTSLNQYVNELLISEDRRDRGEFKDDVKGGIILFSLYRAFGNFIRGIQKIPPPLPPPIALVERNERIIDNMPRAQMRIYPHAVSPLNSIIETLLKFKSSFEIYQQYLPEIFQIDFANMMNALGKIIDEFDLV